MSTEANVATYVASIINNGSETAAERSDLQRIYDRYAFDCYASFHTESRVPVVASSGDRDPTLFEDITSPLQFLGYEHAQDFQALHAGELAMKVVTTMFGAFVWPRKPSRDRGNMGMRIDNPAAVGLIVKKRDEVGYPQLPRHKIKDRDKDVVQRTVQVGTVIMYAALLDIPDFRKEINGMSATGNGQFKAAKICAKDLTEQIDQAQN